MDYQWYFQYGRSLLLCRTGVYDQKNWGRLRVYHGLLRTLHGFHQVPSIYHVSKRLGWVGGWVGLENVKFCCRSVLYLCWFNTSSGWVRKNSKLCWRNIWMVPRLWVECIIVRPCSQAIVALTFAIYVRAYHMFSRILIFLSVISFF